MLNASVKIESAQVERFLDSLVDNDLKRRIIYNAVLEGAKELKKATVSNLRASGSGVAALASGVRVKGNKAYSEAEVNIMGDYRLKWFEKGTAQRLTKDKSTRKSHSTGQIKGLNFFRRARENSESGIYNKIVESINNSMKALQRS